MTIASQLIARVVDDIIDNKQQDRDDNGSAQATLANDSPQWRSNEKENETSQREGKLFLHFNHVPAQGFIILGHAKGAKLSILHVGIGCTNGTRYHHLLFVACQCTIKGVEIDTVLHGHRGHYLIGRLDPIVFIYHSH